jgi:tripartite-type tricarboxylate transporter receptor subunit TctC
MKSALQMKNAGPDAGSRIRRALLQACCASALALGLSTATTAAESAASFPSRPVTIVVPFPAGGATDITGRLVAEGLSKKWGQSVIVENRPGAGGNVGSAYVAKAAPDGYTLILGVTGSHGINVSLYKHMPYDPLKDFEPISQATLYPNAIVVNPSFPASNLKQLVELVKAHPGKYSYGSDGNGTASHLGMEMLKHRAGMEIVHVPYRGSTPMVTDLLGGTIPIGITGLPAVQPYVRSGKLKLIAITTAHRFASSPGYPTVAEQGYPGYAAAPWSGFFAPKGTPHDIVEKISRDMRAVMSDSQARKKMESVGSELTPSTPQQFHDFVANEIKKWKEAVQISGAHID